MSYLYHNDDELSVSNFAQHSVFADSYSIELLSIFQFLYT